MIIRKREWIELTSWKSYDREETASILMKQMLHFLCEAYLQITQEINKLGTYKIKINLHSEVSTNVLVIVKKTDAA